MHVVLAVVLMSVRAMRKKRFWNALLVWSNTGLTTIAALIQINAAIMANGRGLATAVTVSASQASVGTAARARINLIHHARARTEPAKRHIYVLTAAAGKAVFRHVNAILVIRQIA